MRVLHLPYCFHPDPVGGTEIYVASLARELQTRNIEPLIAAPGEQAAAYEYDGLRVLRFAVSPQPADLRELYGEGDERAAREFGLILEREQPDIVHLHAFTRAVSVRTVRQAKQRGIPIVFTYHTPTVSCQRGTLLRWGKQICDGRLDAETCTACTLHGLGMPRPIAGMLARTPIKFGRAVGRAHLGGGIWTALRMRELLQLRQASFRTLMANVDHVVALCAWTHDLLIRNGVPSAKISIIRHGLADSQATPQHVAPAPEANDRILRMVALGRLDPAKGFDTLIRAVRSLPESGIQLDIYGVAQGKAGDSYARQLKQLAAADPRIHFHAPVPGDAVVTLLKQYDLLAVPSRVVETGPLVVLEAFQAGVSVIGSSLGGIAELVEHDTNGVLVEPNSATAWQREIGRLVQDRTALARLRLGIRTPRRMQQTAQEMAALYEKCLAQRIA